MNAPDRIWAWEYKGNTPWGPIKPNMDIVTYGAEYLRADGPTITAWKAALRALGADPDSIAREAQKEASNG